jgi:hypothetical protein
LSRFIVTADWDNNAPHLTPEAKKDLFDSIPAYQKDARTRGIPQLGAGIIYPIPEDDIVVEDFPIPKHWPRGYGLDVGWNRTASLFRARNPDTGVSYFYAEYYRGEASPEIHAAAIKALASMRADGSKTGVWMPGRIDPAARGRNQVDGEKLLKMYRELIYGTEDLMVGKQLLKEANNAVESGLYEVLMALQQGRLKVFKYACRNWLAERRLYRRDEKGRVVKKNDHAQDAGRYCVASGETWLAQEPVPVVASGDPMARFIGSGAAGYGWMNV